MTLNVTKDFLQQLHRGQGWSILTLTPGLIEPLVRANMTAMDDYFLGIQAVIEGSATPAEAVAAIEDDDDDYDVIV